MYKLNIYQEQIHFVRWGSKRTQMQAVFTICREGICVRENHHPGLYIVPFLFPSVIFKKWLVFTEKQFIFPSDWLKSVKNGLKMEKRDKNSFIFPSKLQLTAFIPVNSGREFRNFIHPWPHPLFTVGIYKFLIITIHYHLSNLILYHWEMICDLV